jgi:hypothetical protein
MIDFTKELPADISKLSVEDIRQLRDYVFERKLSDVSWSQVVSRWMLLSEQEWLLRYAREMQRTRNTKK